MQRTRPTFLVLAHADPILFKRLVGRLRNVGNVVAHIDRKADAADYLVDGVHYLDRRFDVKWAGYSMVEATLELMRRGLSLFPDSSHMVLLSGACYPIVSDKALIDYFERNGGVNLIRLYDVGATKTHFWHHINEYHLRDLIGGRGSSVLARGLRVMSEHALNLTKRRWPQHINPYAGSQWWGITSEVCFKIIQLAEDDPVFSSKIWRWVLAPDEIYFHTALGYVAQSSGGIEYSTSPYQKDNAVMHLVDQSLTKIYREEDLNEVVAARSSGKIFVRKLDSFESRKLIDWLDAHLA